MASDDTAALRDLRAALARRFAARAREPDAPLPELRDLQERLRLLDAAIADTGHAARGRRRMAWFALVAVAAVLSLGALVPVPSVPFTLEAEAGAVRLHMAGAGALGPQQVRGTLRIDGFTRLESPDAGLAPPAGERPAGRLAIDAAMLNLRRIAYPAGTDIAFAAGTQAATVTLHGQRAPVTVDLEWSGRTTTRLGPGGKARQAEYPFAERLRVAAATAAGAPPPLAVVLARPAQVEYGWTSLRPREVRFVERILGEGNEAVLRSSLRRAHIMLRASAAEVALGAGEDLELGGLDLQRCDVLLGPVIKVRMAGTARSLLARTGRFERSLKPSLLEYAARHQTVALLWSAGLMLWGIVRWLQRLADGSA